MASTYRTSLGRLALRFVLPALIIIVLFLVMIYAVILPVYSEALLQDRKDEARDLTATATGILKLNAEKAAAGEMEDSQARAKALEMVRSLRYGSDGKNYFWIIDTTPVMIEHPYRPDLVGEDLRAYRDEKGNRVFLEMVRTALDRGEGFVEYSWQYEDESGTETPKISHVRLFEPWNWIVGTGIYVDDVRLHIKRVSSDILWISGIIVLAIGSILVANLRSAARIDEERQRAEAALLASKERYKALVESSEAGLIMLGTSGIIFMNPQAERFTGYGRGELSSLGPERALPCLPRLRERLEGAESAIPPEPGEILTKSGESLPFLIGAYPFTAGQDQGMVINFQPIRTPQPYAPPEEDSRDELIVDLQLALSRLYDPVGSIEARKLSCDAESPVREAVSLCSHEGATAALVRGKDGRAMGIITDRDVRERVAAAGTDLSAPCLSVMSAPLISIQRGAQVFDALNAMVGRSIGHLAVKSETGAIEGLISMQDLVAHIVDSSSFLLHQIKNAPDEFALGSIYRRVAVLIRSLSRSGVSAKPIIRLLVAIAENAVRRVVELVLERRSGEPPAEFVFLAFGSLAREETLVYTDQDNGLAYRDPADDPAIAAWFLSFGREICRGLELAGFRACPGRTMASEADFNLSAGSWRKRLGSLLAAGDPDSLMRWAIVYDMRPIYGSQGLAAEIKSFRQEALAGNAAARNALAKLLLNGKVPLDIFGNLPAGILLKGALIPLVNAAKAYAMLEGIEEVSTLGRLERLHDRSILLEADREALANGLLLLMDLRLKALKDARLDDPEGEKAIAPMGLNDWERILLKKTLARISLFQAGLAGRKSSGGHP